MSVGGIDVGNKCLSSIKHGGSQFRPEFKITDITGYKLDLARDKAEKKMAQEKQAAETAAAQIKVRDEQGAKKKAQAARAEQETKLSVGRAEQNKKQEKRTRARVLFEQQRKAEIFHVQPEDPNNY